jgi:hypothetical protein
MFLTFIISFLDFNGTIGGPQADQSGTLLEGPGAKRDIKPFVLPKLSSSQQETILLVSCRKSVNNQTIVECGFTQS